LFGVLVIEGFIISLKTKMKQNKFLMKTTKLISGLAVACIGMVLSFTSCEPNEQVEPQKDLLPARFRVEIPNSISNINGFNSGRASGRIKEDTLQGNDIYLHLNTFIAVGDGAAQIAEEIINGIRKYKIDRVQSLTFTSDDDGRTKNLVVLSDVAFEGASWDYELTVTDAQSETQTDGGKALQVFWNRSQLVKGIAIIKPFNTDRIENADSKDAVFRIDYTEGGSLSYDAYMEVTISGLTLDNPLNDPFSVSTLKMFAGKKGDVVDVFGNTNHPNAKFFTGNVGFNWAFVASGNDATDIGVAEVGLPPSALDNGQRDVLLKEFSIKNVFTNEIETVWPGIDQTLLNAYLANTEAPGYFGGKTGFIAAGVSPGATWDVLANRIKVLAPYNPKTISQLVVTFK